MDWDEGNVDDDKEGGEQDDVTVSVFGGASSLVLVCSCTCWTFEGVPGCEGVVVVTSASNDGRTGVWTSSTAPWDMVDGAIEKARKGMGDGKKEEEKE